jgi:hypothetical protein
VKLARDDASSELSEMIKTTRVRFRRQAPNYFEDWHAAPLKQYVITLSGRGEIEVTGGKSPARAWAHPPCGRSDRERAHLPGRGQRGAHLNKIIPAVQ